MRAWTEVAIIAIPDWVARSQTDFQSRKYTDEESKIGFVLSAAKENSRLSNGAALAAAVFLDDGSLVSLGVDAPGIGGHEMTNALIIASNVLGISEFRGKRNWDLYSLAPPCSVCLGNIFNERPRKFVCAVTHEDLLAALSLPNTHMPGLNWQEVLTGRGIIVESAIKRAEGRAILSQTVGN